MPEIIVHGGAGSVPDERREKRKPILHRAADRGLDLLEDGRSALDAVEEAVVTLESSPLFNAGTGSVLTIDGRVEMDAALMEDSGRCGAVTELTRVEHPVRVARMVLEETDHLLLAGRGLEQFVQAFDLPRYDPVTDRRREKWEDLMEVLKKEGYPIDEVPDPTTWGHSKSIVREFLEETSDDTTETVGAVARDRDGNLATATSTGGTPYKLPGRVGDTPLPGAGTYAAGPGAVSATGDGEEIMRMCVAKAAVSRMEETDAGTAAEETIEEANRRDVSCGLVCVDRDGDVGASHNTEMMDVARRGG